MSFTSIMSQMELLTSKSISKNYFVTHVHNLETISEKNLALSKMF